MQTNTIHTFRDLFELLPEALQDRIFGLCKVPQRLDYHPEGNTLKHTIIVVERAIRLGNINLILAALFHDVGKDETFELSSKGFPTAHGHEKVSGRLVIEYRSFIRSLGGNPVVVYFIVRHHMRMKRFDEMRKSKRVKLMDNPSYDILKVFSLIDRGGRDILTEEEKYYRHFMV